MAVVSLALGDFLSYDPDEPAREVLISLAEKYSFDVSYLHGNVITKAEIWTIYKAELKAMRSHPDFKASLQQSFYLQALNLKYRNLLKALQDVRRADFRALFTKAAVEDLVCILEYERKDGSIFTYTIQPYEWKTRGYRGDLCYAVASGKGIRSFLALGFISLSLTDQQFEPDYPLKQSMQNYYDRHKLADLVIDRDGIVGDPDAALEPSTTVPVGQDFVINGISYHCETFFDFLSVFQAVYKDLVDAVIDWSLAKPWDILTDNNYISIVKLRYETYRIFANAFPEELGSLKTGSELREAIFNDSDFLSGLSSLPNYEWMCALIVKWAEPNALAQKGIPAWKLYLDEFHTGAANQRKLLCNDPDTIKFGLAAMFETFGM